MKTKYALISSIAVFLMSFLFLECTKSSSNANPDNNNNPGTIIYMKNSTFSNTDLGIAEGGTVTWINDDVMIHTVTASDGSFDSGDIPVGGRYTRTFNAAGVYRYRCTHHSTMIGQISVYVR